MTQNARKGRSYFKPGMSPAAGGITVTNPHLKRQDIGDWTKAVNAARSALFPRRKQLHDLYDNIVLDGHVQSVLLARTSQVANRPLRWFTKGKPEPEGKEDVYKTVIATPWFHRFIEGAMSAVPYGTTVLELVLKAGEVHDVAVIPRANVAPEQGLVLEDPYQYEKGIDYRNDPYWSKYLIEVGDAKNYGGLLVAAMYVLYKRGGFSNWAQYMEMFGMPLRKGTYNPYDDASRTKLTSALEQMGSASWIVLPEGSNVEFIAASNSSGTGSADLYDKNIERCNAEISKLFLGQTLTTESGDKGARSLGEVHQETKNDIAQADMRRLEFLLNYELRPRLVQLGYPLQDGEFHFYEEATMPAMDRIAVDMQVAQQVPIPDSYWYKTYGIPAPTAAEMKAISERKQAAQFPWMGGGRTPAGPATQQEEEGNQQDDEVDRALTANLTDQLEAYYQLPPQFTAAGNPKGVPPHIWDRIEKGIRSGEITGDSVDPELMQWLANEFTKELLAGHSIADDAGPPQLTPEHQRQIQVFSGFKTNAQLRDATDALYDDNGKMVSWSSFKGRIRDIDEAYNVRYLKAEYEMAKANRSAIENWNEAQRMKNVAPFLRYSTVGDERVRQAHAAMEGVIKPVDDPFWDVWMPPNGWNCRCTVIPELNDKGGKPVPDDIAPPKTMFANNVGKNGVIFPKGHPYEKQASEEARKRVKELADQAMEKARRERKAPKPAEPAKPVPVQPETPKPVPKAPVPIVPIVPKDPKVVPNKHVTPKQAPAKPEAPKPEPKAPAPVPKAPKSVPKKPVTPKQSPVKPTVPKPVPASKQAPVKPNVLPPKVRHSLPARLKDTRIAIRKEWTADLANSERVLDRSGALEQDFGTTILPNLSQAVRAAVREYTIDGMPWNTLLKMAPDEAAVVPGIMALRQAMRDHPTKEPGVFYRAIQRTVDVDRLMGFVQQAKPGDALVLTGFTSTTIDPRRAIWNKVVMRFYAPAGTRALYLEEISSTPREFEMLMDHNQVVRFLGSEQVDGVYFADFIIIP